MCLKNRRFYPVLSLIGSQMAASLPIGLRWGEQGGREENPFAESTIHKFNWLSGRCGGLQCTELAVPAVQFRVDTPGCLIGLAFDQLGLRANDQSLPRKMSAGKYRRFSRHTLRLAFADEHVVAGL